MKRQPEEEHGSDIPNKERIESHQDHEAVNKQDVYGPWMVVSRQKKPLRRDMSIQKNIRRKMDTDTVGDGSRFAPLEEERDNQSGNNVVIPDSTDNELKESNGKNIRSGKKGRSGSFSKGEGSKAEIMDNTAGDSGGTVSMQIQERIPIKSPYVLPTGLAMIKKRIEGQEANKGLRLSLMDISNMNTGQVMPQANEVGIRDVGGQDNGLCEPGVNPNHNKALAHVALLENLPPEGLHGEYVDCMDVSFDPTTNENDVMICMEGSTQRASSETNP